MVLESHEICVYSVRYRFPNLTKTVVCRQRSVKLSNNKFHKILFSNFGFVMCEQTYRHAESNCRTFANVLYESAKYVVLCEMHDFC
jgi:hypothetical protein